MRNLPGEVSSELKEGGEVWGKCVPCFLPSVTNSRAAQGARTWAGPPGPRASQTLFLQEQHGSVIPGPKEVGVLWAGAAVVLPSLFPKWGDKF